jgi:hypothetical protein
VGHGSRPLSRPTEAGTMLSMPLAYPSTLDRRPPMAHIRNGRRPTWRSFGARSSHSAGNWQAKAHAYCQRLFPARSAEIFLSRAGPQLDLECFTLSITFWFRRWSDRLQYEKGDPVGSPSSGSLCS